MVKVLIDYGADLNVYTFCRRPLLLECLKNNYIEMAKLLINNGADINITANGCTLLYYCIGDDKRKELLDFLFEQRNLDTNTQQGDFGRTPLLRAIYNKDIDTVQKLLEHGADVNLCSYNGTSPLYEATKYGDLNIIKLLLEYGAYDEDINNT
jgi:ankyrin repeat protein